MIKRGCQGTYHQMGPEHLHRYVAEFLGRHNQCLLDTLDQMGEAVGGGNGKQTTYEALIADGSHTKRREMAA